MVKSLSWKQLEFLTSQSAQTHKLTLFYPCFLSYWRFAVLNRQQGSVLKDRGAPWGQDTPGILYLSAPHLLGFQAKSPCPRPLTPPRNCSTMSEDIHEIKKPTCPFLIRDSRKSWHCKCIINTVQEKGNKDLIFSKAEGKKAALQNCVFLAFQEAQMPLPPEQATFCPHTTFKMLLRPGYCWDHYTATTPGYSKGHRHKNFISAQKLKGTGNKVKPALTNSKLQHASGIPIVLLQNQQLKSWVLWPKQVGKLSKGKGKHWILWDGQQVSSIS